MGLLRNRVTAMQSNKSIDKHVALTVVTCEIYLFWNNTKIISVFYFTRNHDGNWNKIISAAETVLELFQNYLSYIAHVGNYSRAAIILWNNFEIISGKLHVLKWNYFRRTSTNSNEVWNNFISRVTRALVRYAAGNRVYRK